MSTKIQFRTSTDNRLRLRSLHCDAEREVLLTSSSLYQDRDSAVRTNQYSLEPPFMMLMLMVSQPFLITWIMRVCGKEKGHRERGIPGGWRKTDLTKVKLGWKSGAPLSAFFFDDFLIDNKLTYLWPHSNFVVSIIKVSASLPLLRPQLKFIHLLKQKTTNKSWKHLTGV